ncbi:hypothetical protein [Plantibacter sp. YIM 135249]|jgi:hypothetical protein|uniref:hypothetical protein n=1 Tax=Plantibacter sp. YIM 135249 TaxID=3423918 RepID=UPI003D33ABAC
MSGTITITTRKKQPLDIDYDGVVYRLPGRIPPRLLTAQSEIRRPTLTTQAVKDEYDKQVGVTILSVFYELVLPEELQSVIDLEDIEPVFSAWSEHVELGKSQKSVD